VQVHAVGTRRVVTTVSLYEDSSGSDSSSSSGSSGTLLKFSVRDYGEGCLTPAATARLFQKFTQLQRTDGTSNLGGLGLGLFGVATKARVLGEPHSIPVL
jgi:signal transduction histidine kinase